MVILPQPQLCWVSFSFMLGWVGPRGAGLAVRNPFDENLQSLLAVSVCVLGIYHTYIGNWNLPFSSTPREDCCTINLIRSKLGSNYRVPKKLFLLLIARRLLHYDSWCGCLPDIRVEVSPLGENGFPHPHSLNGFRFLMTCGTWSGYFLWIWLA